MFSYSLYKVVHICGVLMVFFSLGAAVLQMLNSSNKNFPNRKLIGIFHGVGLFLALLGGFGLLARLNLNTGWPMWVWSKLGIWIVLGGIIALIYKKPAMNKALWYAIPAIGVLAAYLAQYKPF